MLNIQVEGDRSLPMANEPAVWVPKKEYADPKDRPVAKASKSARKRWRHSRANYDVILAQTMTSFAHNFQTVQIIPCSNCHFDFNFALFITAKYHVISQSKSRDFIATLCFEIFSNFCTWTAF